MSTRLWKLLISAAVISATVSYLFFLNPERVPVHWGPGESRVWSPPLAFLLVALFFTGATFAALVGMLFGARYQLRDWKLTRLRRLREAHTGKILEAREQLARGDFDGAAKQFRAVLERDPEDLVTRMLLASSYAEGARTADALRVLQDTPLSQKSNSEVLGAIAELHAASGNRLAACDALRIILAKDPNNSRLLLQLRNLSAELERYDDAVRFGEQLARVARSPDERRNALAELAELELCKVRAEAAAQGSLHTSGGADDHAPYRTALEDLLRRHSEFGPALLELAALERDSLNVEAASRLLVRAFRSLRQVEILHQIATLWLGVDEPQKAIANVKNLVREVGTVPKMDGCIFLTALLLVLENIDAASDELRRLRAQPERSNGDAPPSPNSLAEAAVLEAMLLRKSGDEHGANDSLLRAFGNLLPNSTLRLLGNGLLKSGDDTGEKGEGWTERARLNLRSQGQPSPRLLES